MSETQRIEEVAGVATGRVDRAACMVRNVKVVGRESKNGRLYPPSTLSTAVRLYDGVACYLNHAEPGRRRYEDRFATVRNPAAQGDGLFASLHYNPKHPRAEQFLHDAEHSPENCGLSHVIDAKVSRRKDGLVVVEAILKVESVDIVAAPATTVSLFEQVGGRPDFLAMALAAGLPRELAEGSARAVEKAGMSLHDARLYFADGARIFRAATANRQAAESRGVPSLRELCGRPDPHPSDEQIAFVQELRGRGPCSAERHAEIIETLTGRRIPLAGRNGHADDFVRRLRGQ